MMPMAWGLLRGQIMLPAEAVDWSEEQVDAVLLHELAHLRRRDPLSLLAAHLVRSIYWFHPAVWAVAWRLRVERERACDDLVLESRNAPQRLCGIAAPFGSSPRAQWGAVARRLGHGEAPHNSKAASARSSTPAATAAL